MRPLDIEEQSWEISHDFLVPLLDSILARWTTSFWKRFRFWLPWCAAAALLVFATFPFRQPKDPTLELMDLGWAVAQTKGALELQFLGDPPKQSIRALRRINKPLSVKIATSVLSKDSFSGWGDLDIPRMILNGPLKDVSALRDIKSPIILVLLSTRVSDLSPVRDFSNLEVFAAVGARITDLSPLTSLTHLVAVDITRTNVNDISPLRNLKQLATLNLRGTKVNDVAPLRGLGNLIRLDLSYTKVTSVSALKALTKLQMLDVTGLQIEDLTPVKGIKGLSILGAEAGSKSLYFELPPTSQIPFGPPEDDRPSRSKKD